MHLNRRHSFIDTELCVVDSGSIWWLATRCNSVVLCAIKIVDAARPNKTRTVFVLGCSFVHRLQSSFPRSILTSRRKDSFL